MSRLFNGSIEDYLQFIGTMGITGDTTMLVWFKPNGAGIGLGGDLITYVNNSGATNDRLSVTKTGEDKIRMTGEQQYNANQQTDTAVVLGDWVPIIALFEDMRPRLVYPIGGVENSGFYGNMTADDNPHFIVGVNSTIDGAGLHGKLGQITIWNGILSAADILLIQSGEYPTKVSNATLNAHWPLTGPSLVDSVGGKELIIHGSVPLDLNDNPLTSGELYTVKTSGGDYTYIEQAIDAQKGDLTGRGVVAFKMHDMVDSSQLTVDEAFWTNATDSDYVRIYAAEDARHNGISREKSGKGYQNTRNGTNSFRIACSYTRIEGIEHLSDASGSMITIINTDLVGIKVWDMLTVYTGASNGNYMINETSGANSEIEFDNCLFVGDKRFADMRGLGSAIFNNCGYYGNGAQLGLVAEAETTSLNTWVLNSTDDFWGVLDVADYCASRDTSATENGKSNGFVSIIPEEQFARVSIDPKIFDFSLRSGSIFGAAGKDGAHIGPKFHKEKVRGGQATIGNSAAPIIYASVNSLGHTTWEGMAFLYEFTYTKPTSSSHWFYQQGPAFTVQQSGSTSKLIIKVYSTGGTFTSYTLTGMADGERVHIFCTTNRLTGVAEWFINGVLVQTSAYPPSATIGSNNSISLRGSAIDGVPINHHTFAIWKGVLWPQPNEMVNHYKGLLKLSQFSVLPRHGFEPRGEGQYVSMLRDIFGEYDLYQTQGPVRDEVGAPALFGNVTPAEGLGGVEMRGMTPANEYESIASIPRKGAENQWAYMAKFRFTSGDGSTFNYLKAGTEGYIRRQTSDAIRIHLRTSAENLTYNLPEYLVEGQICAVFALIDCVTGEGTGYIHGLPSGVPVALTVGTHRGNAVTPKLNGSTRDGTDSALIEAAIWDEGLPSAANIYSYEYEGLALADFDTPPVWNVQPRGKAYEYLASFPDLIGANDVTHIAGDMHTGDKYPYAKGELIDENLTPVQPETLTHIFTGPENTLLSADPKWVLRQGTVDRAKINADGFMQFGSWGDEEWYHVDTLGDDYAELKLELTTDVVISQSRIGPAIRMHAATADIQYAALFRTHTADTTYIQFGVFKNGSDLGSPVTVDLPVRAVYWLAVRAIPMGNDVMVVGYIDGVEVIRRLDTTPLALGYSGMIDAAGSEGSDGVVSQFTSRAPLISAAETGGPAGRIGAFRTAQHRTGYAGDYEIIVTPPTGGITVEADVTFSMEQLHSTAKSAIYEAGLSMALEAGQADGNNAQVNAGITYVIEQDDGYGATAEMNATLSLAQGVSVNFTGGRALESAITMATSLGVNQSATISIEGAVTFATELLSTAESQAAMQAVLALNAEQGLTATTGANIDAMVTLGVQQAVSSTSGRTLAATVALALQSGMASSVDVSIEGAVSLGLTADMLSAAQADMLAGIDFGTTYAHEVMKSAVLQAGLALGTIQSITQSGSSISFNVVTPDGRTLTINFQNRELIIDAGNREI